MIKVTSRGWYLRLLACLPLVWGMGPNSVIVWGPCMYFFQELYQGIHILSTALFLLGSDRVLYECILLYIYGASAWPLYSEVPSLASTFSSYLLTNQVWFIIWFLVCCVLSSYSPFSILFIASCSRFLGTRYSLCLGKLIWSISTGREHKRGDVTRCPNRSSEGRCTWRHHGIYISFSDLGQTVCLSSWKLALLVLYHLIVWTLNLFVRSIWKLARSM